MRTDPGYPPENLNKFSMYIACSWKTDSCQYLFRRNSFKVPFIFTFARITRLIIFVCKLVSLAGEVQLILFHLRIVVVLRCAK